MPVRLSRCCTAPAHRELEAHQRSSTPRGTHWPRARTTPGGTRIPGRTDPNSWHWSAPGSRRKCHSGNRTQHLTCSTDQGDTQIGRCADGASLVRCLSRRSLGPPAWGPRTLRDNRTLLPAQCSRCRRRQTFGCWWSTQGSRIPRCKGRCNQRRRVGQHNRSAQGGKLLQCRWRSRSHWSKAESCCGWWHWAPR